MWLFTKYGFYSVVCSREGDGAHGQPVDPGRVMVRARVRGHLEALKARLPELLAGSEIQHSKGTDYAYRLFVDKARWSSVLVRLNEEMDYDNFKSEVGRGQGNEAYEQALHEVWGVMRRPQQ